MCRSKDIFSYFLIELLKRVGELILSLGKSKFAFTVTNYEYTHTIEQ